MVLCFSRVLLLLTCCSPAEVKYSGTSLLSADREVAISHCTHTTAIVVFECPQPSPCLIALSYAGVGVLWSVLAPRCYCPFERGVNERDMPHCICGGARNKVLKLKASDKNDVKCEENLRVWRSPMKGTVVSSRLVTSTCHAGGW